MHTSNQCNTVKPFTYGWAFRLPLNFCVKFKQCCNKHLPVPSVFYILGNFFGTKSHKGNYCIQKAWIIYGFNIFIKHYQVIHESNFNTLVTLTPLSKACSSETISSIIHCSSYTLFTNYRYCFLTSCYDNEAIAQHHFLLPLLIQGRLIL